MGLAALKPGEKVNIEVKYLGCYSSGYLLGNAMVEIPGHGIVVLPLLSINECRRDKS